MGWSYGVLPDGREVGYAVEAVCDEPGCDTVIDRGLSYVCGGMHGGGAFGCGDYFCPDHLFYLSYPPDSEPADRCGALCDRCSDD